MAAAIAKHAGARHVIITDVNDYRLEMSGNAGALRDMLGIPADSVAIDWRKVIFNMLTIKCIYGREIFETWYKMTVMIQSAPDLKPIITHRLPFTQFQEGFDAALSGRSGRIILNWD